VLLVHGLKSLFSEVAVEALLRLTPAQIVRNLLLLLLTVSEVFFEALL
jgi:hypothetical protein